MKVVVHLFVGFVDYLGRPIPNFIWEDLKGKPIVFHIIEKLKKSKRIDRIVPYYFLSKNNIHNEKIIGLSKKYNLEIYPHLQHSNVNFWKCSVEFRERLNITKEWVEIHLHYGVSPLIDIDLIDMLVERFIHSNLEYLTTKNLPEGTRIDIHSGENWHKFYKFDPEGKLARSGQILSLLSKKEVFTVNEALSAPELSFSTNSMKGLNLLRKIYNEFPQEREISLKDVIALYRKTPDDFEVLFAEQIEIELTNDCNLKCIMCPRQRMKRPIGYMDFDLYKKIIDESIGMNVIFSLFGEPLMHPDFLRMVEYANGKVNVILYTNAINLDEETSRAILENPSVTTIFFSLDAASAETYRKIKGADVYDKAIKNIYRFLNMREEKTSMSYPIVAVQILKMKENDHEIEQFWSRWNKREGTENLLPDYVVIGHFNNFCGQIEDRSVIDVTPLKRIPCKQLKSGISVLWNGDVVLCRQDFDGKYPLGNLKKQSLKQILEGEQLKEIWQTHKDGEYNTLPLCKYCKEWYYNLYA